MWVSVRKEKMNEFLLTTVSNGVMILFDGLTFS